MQPEKPIELPVISYLQAQLADAEERYKRSEGDRLSPGTIDILGETIRQISSLDHTLAPQELKETIEAEIQKLSYEIGHLEKRAQDMGDDPYWQKQVRRPMAGAQNHYDALKKYLHYLNLKETIGEESALQEVYSLNAFLPSQKE